MSTRDNVSGAIVAIAGASTDLATDLKAPLTGLDTQNADGVKFIVRTGPFVFSSINEVVWRVQHSDSIADGTFVPVTQADVIGVTVLDSNGTVKVYDAEVVAPGDSFVVGYRGNKRYVRMKSNESGTVTSATAQVFSELTYLHREGKTVTS